MKFLPNENFRNIFSEKATGAIPSNDGEDLEPFLFRVFGENAVSKLDIRDAPNRGKGAKEVYYPCKPIVGCGVKMEMVGVLGGVCP